MRVRAYTTGESRMNRSSRVVIGVLSMLTVVTMTELRGQTPSTTGWTPPKTVDGQPDLQGVWSFATVTPLQRPSALAGKEVLGEEEAADFAATQIRRQNRDLIDPKKGGANYPPESRGGVVPYNEFWYDRGTAVVRTRRTSLIVDPPDGRIPPLTADGKRRAAARAASRGDSDGAGGRADWTTDRNLAERCIVGFNSGPPMMPSAYNNNVQIFQSRDYVVIFNEMIQSARIVPVTARQAPPPPIRSLLGHSRGRWEGNTLVVETTNFTDKTAFQGSSENLRLVERFTRSAADTLLYEFTIDDPATFERPWTAQIPMSRLQGLIYEYACHEGNYGMEGILAGARAQEKARQSGPK